MQLSTQQTTTSSLPYLFVQILTRPLIAGLRHVYLLPEREVLLAQHVPGHEPQRVQLVSCNYNSFKKQKSQVFHIDIIIIRIGVLMGLAVYNRLVFTIW